MDRGGDVVTAKLWYLGRKSGRSRLLNHDLGCGDDFPRSDGG